MTFLDNNLRENNDYFHTDSLQCQVCQDYLIVPCYIFQIYLRLLVLGLLALAMVVVLPKLLFDCVKIVI